MATKGVIVTAPVPTLDDTARLFGISSTRRRLLDEMIAQAAVPAHSRNASGARRTSRPRVVKKAAARKSTRRGETA